MIIRVKNEYFAYGKHMVENYFLTIASNLSSFRKNWEKQLVYIRSTYDKHIQLGNGEWSTNWSSQWKQVFERLSYIVNIGRYKTFKQKDEVGKWES